MIERTPGDWLVMPGDFEDEHAVVAKLDGIPDDFEEVVVAECFTEADARLCAAAPRLLAECERAEWLLSQNEELYHGSPWENERQILVGLRAAIAAAKIPQQSQVVP